MKFSFVVPAYNVDTYLGQCLDSISSQSYLNWECVCIDDGSEDNTGRIADEFAAKDPRIKVVHQENGGLSSARNTGIENAKGEWLIFVDADDYVAPDLCERYERAIREKPNTVIFAHRMKLVDAKGGELPAIRQTTVCDIMESHTDHIHAALARSPSAWFLLAAWGKCYRADIIREHNLKYDPRLSPGEDSDFTNRYLAFAEGLFVVDFSYVGYYYRQHTESITHKELKVKRRLAGYELIEEQAAFAKKYTKTIPLFARGLLGYISRVRLAPPEVRAPYLDLLINSPVWRRSYLPAIMRYCKFPYNAVALILWLTPRIIVRGFLKMMLAR